MKRIVLATLVAVGAPAQAERAIVPQAAETDNGDFWREIADPHADEVNGIVTRMDQMLVQFDMGYLAESDPTGENKLRSLQMYYGQLRYARKLSPNNVAVLVHLGRVADDLGKTKQAIEALTTALGAATADETPEIDGRLGAIYLRMGDLDAAIRYLRLAQTGTLTPQVAQSTLHLATAYAMRGQMGDAIDLLVASQPAVAGYYDPTTMLLGFSLAVMYDRDDERGAAFEELDKLQTTLQQSYTVTVQNALGGVRFTPAEDQHYFNALLYESGGDYTEARAEWALYAAAHGQWRDRALEHIAAIDAEKLAHPGVKNSPTQQPTYPGRRRRPRP